MVALAPLVSYLGLVFVFCSPLEWSAALSVTAGSYSPLAVFLAIVLPSSESLTPVVAVFSALVLST